MSRIDIINSLIAAHSYARYLEIGVQDRVCFDAVVCEHKDGVDPRGNCQYVMTSDKFFSTPRGPYDIIFVDGDHRARQALRDITNALSVLSDGGVVVVHDCNPTSKREASNRSCTGSWMGTVYRAIAHLQSHREDLEIQVVDTDAGVGIIRRGLHELVSLPWHINYEYLDKHRQRVLNLIPPEEFRP